MFYDLPYELQSLIFSYDNTYREIFDRVLEEIHPFQFYKGEQHDKQFYMIVCLSSFRFWTTNSLTTPQWIYGSQYNDIEYIYGLTQRLQLHRISCREKDCRLYYHTFLSRYPLE